jgi:hypothetical protein
MDAHVAGKTPKYKDLHIHKKVNRRHKSVEIRIPVDINKSIRVEGHDDEIRNEIEQTLKKSQKEQIIRDFANEVIDKIATYDEIKEMDKQKQKKVLIDYAKRLAEYFKMLDFRDVMSAEIDNKRTCQIFCVNEPPEILIPFHLHFFTGGDFCNSL